MDTNGPDIECIMIILDKSHYYKTLQCGSKNILSDFITSNMSFLCWLVLQKFHYCWAVRRDTRGKHWKRDADRLDRNPAVSWEVSHTGNKCTDDGRDGGHSLAQHPYRWHTQPPCRVTCHTHHHHRCHCYCCLRLRLLSLMSRCSAETCECPSGDNWDCHLHWKDPGWEQSACQMLCSHWFVSSKL